jgi:transcriptional regulator with XRE-family HTH domain
MAAEAEQTLAEIDLTALGKRLRHLRVTRELTQEDVAAADVSVAYVSRIEAGQRRPGMRVLEGLAERLGVSVEEILDEDRARRASSEQQDRVRLQLDYAELSLAAGQADQALTQAQAVLDEIGSGAPHSTYQRASMLRARSLEASGRVQEAVVALEDVLTSEVRDRSWLQACIALSRCYRESGDLARAVQVGESALAELDRLGLAGVDEAVQLTVTVAAAHFERGDAAHAARLCDRAITQAEALGSPTARASAYWNASVIQVEAGAIASAIALAEQAVHLMEQSDDLRNLARLRTELGAFLLRLVPPDVERARSYLETARRELSWSSASSTDVARNRLTLAHAHLISGELAEAASIAAETVQAASNAPLLAAEALAVLGQAHAKGGDLQQARETYRLAIMKLTGVGADRGAAQLWFEVGHLLEQADDPDSAREAFRRAAASTGLSLRSSVSVDAPELTTGHATTA